VFRWEYIVVAPLGASKEIAEAGDKIMGGWNDLPDMFEFPND